MLLFCFARFRFTTGTNRLQTGLNASINFAVVKKVSISTISFLFVRYWKKQHLKKIWTKQPYMFIRVSLVKNRLKVTDIATAYGEVMVKAKLERFQIQKWIKQIYNSIHLIHHVFCHKLVVSCFTIQVIGFKDVIRHHQPNNKIITCQAKQDISIKRHFISRAADISLATA